MAFVRQGAKEVGAMLKAFPDTISVDEPWTVFSPTQGEIAEANRGGTVWGRVQEARERSEAAKGKETPEKTPGRE